MRRTTTLLLTSLACSVIAHAQASQTSGSIKGLVNSKKGDFIETGKVVARNLETGFTRTVSLEALGYYSIPLLPIGPYRLTVTSPGMKTVERNVHVSLGQNAVINLEMEPQVAEAVVEIIGQASTLDTTQVNTFTSIDEKLVEAIPVNGRNFTDLVQLTPGAVPQDDRVNVGGARGIQNNLTIDGASYNSSFFGEQRGSTRIPFTFGADTIKELQVITNAFDAQYGNAAGAVINAVTKTGTNDFSGSSLVQWRPSRFVAKIRPVPYDPRGTTNTQAALTREFTQLNLNVNVGGPIIKDKLHYFVGAETFHYKEDFTPAFAVSGSTGSTLTDFNTFLTNYGNLKVGNDGRTLAQESGRTYTQDKKNTVFFARLDWTINENHRATLRLNSQDLKGENYTTALTSSFAPTTGQTNQGLEKDSGLSWVLEVNSVFGSNWVNEGRIQRAIERRPRFANTQASPEFQINGGFTAGQNNFLPNGLDEFTWQLIDNVTYANGDWTLKGGVDLQRFEYANTFFRYQNGAFQFGNYGVANRWQSNTLTTSDSLVYQGSYSDFGGTIAFKGSLYGAYLQAQKQGLWDRRLTINYGVRFTREQWDSNPRPNPVFKGLDQAPSKSAVDPRFGFTLDVWKDGKTILKGGYGEFSTPNPALTVSNTMNSNGNTTSTFRISNGASTAALFLTGASGVLSYNQRVGGSGTVLTALPQSVLRNPGSAGIPASALQRQGQIWDPDAKLTKKKLTALGVDQDLGHGFVAGVRGEYAEFKNLQYFVNVNITQAGGGTYNDGYPVTGLNTFSTARPAAVVVRGRQLALTAAGFGDVFLSKYDGEGDYKAIIFTLSRKLEAGWGFTSSLTWAKAMDNNSNERTTASSTADSNTNNPSNPIATFAPADSDRRFRGVFAGYFPIYWGIQGSGILSYTTGRPFSAVASADINGDGGRNDYVNGTTRNQFRQPAVKTFDMRFVRDFKIVGKFAIEGQIDVFNVFNWANQRTSQTGGQPSNLPLNATFGAIDLPDRSTREVQLGVRLRW